jgi:hypothetical protein
MEETVKALRFARQIVELMEEEEHHAVLSKGAKMAQTDWRSKPFIIAVPTELAAVVAQKHEGDVEIVKTFANRLVHALKQDNFTVSLPCTRNPVHTTDIAQESIDRVSAYSTKTEADFKAKNSQTDALNQYCQGLFELLTIWNALKTSRTVLGADMPLATEAAEFENKIKSVLDTSVDALPRLHRRGDVELRSTYPAYIKEQLQKVQI